MPGQITNISPGGSGSEDSSEDSDRGEEGRSVTKRVRLNDGSSSPASSPEPAADRQVPTGIAASIGNGGSSAAYDFKPGSIVRIKLENFVTYTRAEFNLHPGLNMIIGPNGTGKSTVVCAICMGLGFSTANLGRAKDPSEFIKHGAENASIEVELARDPSRQDSNPIIRRHISKRTNKTTWFLNNESVPQKKISQCVARFSIQIDNLCQFLPQDKVAEFAAMNKIELLESTQRAVAEPQMNDWHQKLKELGKDRKLMEERQAVEKAALSSLQKKQEAVKRDVDRLREREEMQKKMKILECLRPMLEYLEAGRAFKTAKQAKRAAANQLAELEQSVEPAMRELTAKEEYKQKLEASILHPKRQVEERDKSAADLKKRVDDLSTEIFEAKSEVDNIHKQAQARKREVVMLEKKITNMEKQLENPENVEFDPASYNERIRVEQRKLTSFDSEREEIQSRIDSLKIQGSRAKTQITQASQRLSGLNSQSGKQEIKLKDLSSDTSKAWEWLKENQDKFEKPVFGPPAVECSVNDLNFAPQIESLFQNLDFCTFTTQTKADFKKLHAYLHDELHLAEVTLREVHRTPDSFPRPVNNDELRQHGFEGWALDYIQGPDLVLGMLCEQNRLHATAVRRDEPSQSQHERLEASRISSWVTQNSKYQIIRRREYGPGATQTRVEQVGRARVWTDEAVDAATTRQYEQAVTDSEAEWSRLRTEWKDACDKLESMKDDYRDASQEVERLKKEKDELQAEKSRLSGLPTKIQLDKATLEEKKERVKEHMKEKAEKIAQSEDLELSRVQAAIDYAGAIIPLREAHEALYRHELMVLEAKADLDLLNHRNSEVTEALKQAEEEVQNHTRILKDSKAKAEVLVEQTHEASVELETLTNSEEEHKEWTDSVETRNLQDLEEEIQVEKARLDLNDGGDPTILKQYDEREEKILAHTNQVFEYAEELQGLEAQITEVRELWEPRLDSIVAQISAEFSESFEHIGCAGQVSIEKNDDDFTTWAILIHVKFRENEELSVLTAQRQSGGERAVSTIFYLLSLQKLTRSPFRVVDEINQGMDARNERVVHERMVEIACEGDTSQYFLITPKLLTGLKFHEKMSVHVIASGEYMPDEPQGLNLRDAVNIALRRKTAVA